VGGGLEIAILCDMLVMAEDAYVADLHAKINVSGMVALNDFLPPMIARELSMTDRRLTAAECRQFGFANYVEPLEQVLDRALALASAAARMGPDSIGHLKRGSLALQRRSTNLWDDGVRAERRRKIEADLAHVRSDHDRMEGMRSFLERRESQWARPVRAESDTPASGRI
jgi:enoyl-CoA hydratase/carnithine racemase